MDYKPPNRIRLAVMVFAMVFQGSLVAVGGPRTKIAVMELKAERGIDKGLMKLLNELLLTEFGKTGQFDVIGGSDIESMLQHQQQTQMLTCSDVGCLAELGGALGVEKLVYANIGKIGSFYLVNVKIINVRTARVEGRVSYKVEGIEDRLIKAITGSVNELMKGKPGDSVSSVTSDIAAKQVTAKVESASARDQYILWGHISLWSGVGLAAFGGVAAGVSSSAADDYQGGDLGAEETSKTWARIMYAGFGIGAALVTTGLVLWLVAPEDGSPAGRTTATLTPTGDGNGLVFSIGGRW